jgi:hypothetical protein
MSHDSNGDAIPFSANDDVIDCGCIDAAFGDPSTWPEWTDSHVWQLGPDPNEDSATAALREITMIATYLGSDGPVNCQEELEVAAAELEGVIEGLRAAHPEPPSAADCAWLNNQPALPPTRTDPTAPFVPTAQDWADYHEWCKHVDEQNELRRVDDAEYEARIRFGD